MLSVDAVVSGDPSALAAFSHSAFVLILPQEVPLLTVLYPPRLDSISYRLKYSFGCNLIFSFASLFNNDLALHSSIDIGSLRF